MHSANEMNPNIDECKLEGPPTVQYVGIKYNADTSSDFKFVIGFLIGAMISASITFLLIKSFGFMGV